MDRLGSEVGIERLYVKRDDLSGEAYGGNKVRKLEFLLGRALAEGRKTVLTFGGAGSNHALATSIYARQRGLKSVSILLPQPNAHSVHRNLLMGHRAGAALCYYVSPGRAAAGTFLQRQRCRLRDGSYPAVIPPGGSSALGALGFVNAALELKAQVEAGEMPEPDVLYAASGTMGTVIGLAVGLMLAGMRCRVMAVCVTKPPYTSPEKAPLLFGEIVSLLRRSDPSVPKLSFDNSGFILRHGFLGKGYGLYTEESAAAAKRVKEAQGLKLEGTYTGKTFAALLADAEAGALTGKTVLFWNTHNSRDFSAEIEGIDYHELPPGLHGYFEDEVQPLDR